MVGWLDGGFGRDLPQHCVGGGLQGHVTVAGCMGHPGEDHDLLPDSSRGLKRGEVEALGAWVGDCPEDPRELWDHGKRESDRSRPGIPAGDCTTRAPMSLVTGSGWHTSEPRSKRLQAHHCPGSAGAHAVRRQRSSQDVSARCQRACRSASLGALVTFRQRMNGSDSRSPGFIGGPAISQRR